MTTKKGIGKGTVRKSGKGKYDAFWVYIPSRIYKDDSFPFSDKEKIQVEIDNGKLILSKTDDFRDLIMNYGTANATIPKLLEMKAKKNKNRPFLYYKDKTYSYNDLNNNSNRIAYGIINVIKDLNLNVNNRRKVAIWLPNCPEFLFCWFGASKARSTVVLINRDTTINVLKHTLKDSKAEILIIDYQYLHIFKKISRDLTKIKKVIIRNAPKAFNYKKGGFVNFKEICTSNVKNPDLKALAKTKVRNLDQMETLYTLGSSGMPRGVPYFHYMILGGLLMAKEMETLGLDKDQRIYCPLPLYNGIVQILIVFPALFSNASIVLADKLHVSTFWDDIQKYNITILSYFGRMLSILMKQPQRESERNHQVKFAFGAMAPKETWETFENRFGIPLYEAWAVAEGSGLTLNKEGTKGGKLGSIGKPLLGFEVKIVDEKGEELPPGNNNIGEIVSRNSFKRNNTLPWEHSGDLAYKDKDGFIYFVGRINDMIKQGDRLISTLDIENIANRHPFIVESSAFSVPSKRSDKEDIKICIVLKKENILTHEEISAYFYQNLAYYMVPRYIEIKETLSITDTEQINKPTLKAEWAHDEMKINTWDAHINDFLLK